ncbi:MAG TPA: site-specific integrase [Acidobacteriaceae bacterium]|nr:site-specific integrase [Acidobacteriaceae bacterium]
MPRRSTKKERGVFEKEPGSEIWWIRYSIDGRERREKVGRKRDAVDLYRIWKADALRGAKLPTNMKHKGVRFETLGKQAIDWYIEHGRKDIRNFRIRMNIILKDFGGRVADEIKPSEIDAWLKQHDWSPATKNRYKNVFGKTFKLALADGRVTGNPARLVEQRTEKNARLRFLSADEEQRLREAITKRCPDHMPELDLALNTEMRKGEQYSLEWPQISFRRKRILLEETKNGSSREIPMNRSCIAALEALHGDRPHDGRVCQSKFGKDLNDSRSWFYRCVKDAGIQSFTWHCLRHTFISRLVMAGVDLRTVQELAGHKTIFMTVRYAHLAPEHNQAAIEKLDRLIQ